MTPEEEAMYASLFAEGNDKTDNDDLIVPFEIVNPQQSKRFRLEALINRIAKTSPMGKALLEEASKHCVLCFSDDLPADRMGTTSREDGVIYLNPDKDDETLMTTLLHECRHVCQFANGCAGFKSNELTVKSQLMHDRAMEADADACAGVIAYEMACNGDAAVFEKFAQKRTKTASAIVDFAQKNPTGSTDKLMEAAFKGWYDSDYMKEAYEDSYLRRPLSETAYRHTRSAFNRELSTKEVTDLACLGGYLKDPSFLETGKYIDISAKTTAVLNKFFEIRRLQTKKTPDTSYKNIPVRSEKNKKQTPPLNIVLAHNARSR